MRRRRMLIAKTCARRTKCRPLLQQERPLLAVAATAALLLGTFGQDSPGPRLPCARQSDCALGMRRLTEVCARGKPCLSTFLRAYALAFSPVVDREMILMAQKMSCLTLLTRRRRFCQRRRRCRRRNATTTTASSRANDIARERAAKSESAMRRGGKATKNDQVKSRNINSTRAAHAAMPARWG